MPPDRVGCPEVALLSSWTVTGLVLLAGAAGFYSSRRPRPDGEDGDRLRRDYLRGLNFLVNDQPDRALESFMRVAEVDRDTVEMQLALGGLFRRRGEIDRAIRIHQSIVAREHVDGTLREQALHALARDYQRAGLFDRAEQILLALAEGGAYRLPAMRELVGIYELEREWHRAIDVHRRLARIGRPRQETAILHYFCELAEVERAAGRQERAREYLREARNPQRPLPRAALLRADIAIEQGDAGLSIRLLRRAIGQDPGLIDEALPRVMRIARGAGPDGDAMVAAFVAACGTGSRELAFAAIVSDSLEFPALQALVRRFLREDESVAGLIRALGREVDDLDVRALGDVCVVLRRVADNMPRHRCVDCGFTSRSRFWQCPACKTWDSQRPVVRFEFGLDHESAARHG